VDWIDGKEVAVKGPNAVTVSIAPGGVAIIELRLKN
jgi:hypothetical protein